MFILYLLQSWDDELATMAQTHAQQCVFTHDSNRNVGQYTEF